jgi:hypothetical protein
MATYLSRGIHLRQRYPNRWLLLAIVAVTAFVGAGAWALVDHYTAGTTEPRAGPATLTSSGVANKYIAALERLQPSALTPILAKNAVSIDWAYGSGPPFRSAKTLERNWAGVIATSGDAHFRGNLRAAAPNWAAVTWRFRGSTNPITYEPFRMNGLSILNIKQGKVVRETYYWDVPGRNPGIAAAVGRKFATALAAHRPGWGLTLRSLYGKDAIESSVGVAPSASNVDNLIWGRWAFPSFEPLHASLCCAGPSFRLDNGKVRLSWAVVNWVVQNASPGGGKVSGVSILQLKNGKIIRETMYY